MNNNFPVRLVVFIVLCAIVSVPNPLNAWLYGTHHAAVLKAFEYMEGPLASVEQKNAVRFLKISGGNDIHIIIAGKSGNTDEFSDTCAESWWNGKRTAIDLRTKRINISTLWHFLSITKPGCFGNEFPGFSFSFAPPEGGTRYNELLRALLFNHKVEKSGFAGRGISMPVQSISPIEAYRFRGRFSAFRSYYSITSLENYSRFQSVVFEPSTNVAAFWYGQALEGTAVGITNLQHIGFLGHVLHIANDATVTHHLYSTFDHYHDEYEKFVNDNLSLLYSQRKVSELISLFYNSSVGREGLANIMIRDIIFFFARRSAGMTASLYSDLFETRKNCGKEQFCASVAENIIIITKYFIDIHRDDTIRRY